MNSRFVRHLVKSASVLSLGLVFTVGPLVPCNATLYYVAKTGNDGNPGTDSLPWLTIQRAANTMIEGDSVFVRSGRYEERVLPQNSGSSGGYITYAAFPGDSVTVDGTNILLPEWGGLFDLSGTHHIRLQGFRIENAGPNDANTGILADGASHIVIMSNHTYNTISSGIGIWNCVNVAVDSNVVELACNDGDNECITVAVTDTFVVRNNTVHNGGPGTMGGEGIDAKDGSSNGKIYRNRVYGLPARLGIYVDAWDKHTFDIDVYQNVVYDCGADGFALASEAGGLLENVRMYNNIAYRNMFRGLTIGSWGEPGVTEHPMEDIKIINNTFYRNGQGAWGGGIHIENPDAKNVVVRNNIVSQNLSFQIALEGVPLDSVTVDHNLVDGFRGYVGEIFGGDSVVGDPLFADTSAASFRLLSGSPAIDSGSSIDAPPEDFDGTPRPQGAGYDIGAFEYAGTGIHTGEDCPVLAPVALLSHPNPFRTETAIRYQGYQGRSVRLCIYDLSGRLRRTLKTEVTVSGNHTATWNGRDQEGSQLPAGTYFCRAIPGDHRFARQIVFLP
jgi:hypothetical protein